MKDRWIKDFPNLEAILQGTIAGNFSDWGSVRKELNEILDRYEDALFIAYELAYEEDNVL